ncbi:MAG TPA: energy transducer TonB [Planctomycetota bacterium]|nr:energy transducer TonB [Planctomycetota bacterium]
MNRGAWTVAVLVAAAAHAPLALAIFAAEPEKPRSAPPGEERLATIDLRAWRPPERHREHPRNFVAGHGGGARAALRTASSARRARALVRLPERAPEVTPAARAVTIAEGVAARSDADLDPRGTPEERGGPGNGSGGGAGGGAGAGQTFDVNEVDVAPRRLSGSEPTYPRLDALAGREGSVTLRFTVHEDGTVSDVTVQNHQGPSSLIESAREAVLGWRFAPARRGGRAVACLCTQRLTFQLGGRR